MFRFSILVALCAASGILYATVAVAEPQQSGSARDDQFYQARVYPSSSRPSVFRATATGKRRARAG